MNKLTGRSRHSPRHCPVSADAIASQLVRNWKYEAVDRKSSRLVFQEVYDLWRATTPDEVNISDNFSQREFAAALQHLKPGKAPGPDSICPELILHAGTVLKVYNNDRLLSFCPTPTYLGVKLDRSLTFRHHLVALRKKISSRVTLLRRLVGSGWGAGAKTLRIATLSLVYSTAEYCAPVWCCCAHTRLIDSVLNDALRIVTGCLRPTPTDHLSVLSGIQPAELRRVGATLSLPYRGSLDPDHILHGLLSGSSDTGQVRLRSRRPFVSGARNQPCQTWHPRL